MWPTVLSFNPWRDYTWKISYIFFNSFFLKHFYVDGLPRNFSISFQYQKVRILNEDFQSKQAFSTENSGGSQSSSTYLTFYITKLKLFLFPFFFSFSFLSEKNKEHLRVQFSQFTQLKLE